MNTASLFTELQQLQTAPGSVERRIVPHCLLDLFAFVDLPAGRCGFRVMLPSNLASQLDSMPDLKGLRLWLDKGLAQTRLTLRPASEAFQEVFIALVEDLAAQAEAATSREEAASALLHRLILWQQLLMHISPDGLSPEAQRGLYGELWFLKNHLMLLLPASAAIKAWTGPSRASKDFQLPGGAVEVKTSIQGNDQLLVIHGERQLDNTGLSLLVLAHISLSVQKETAETLPDLIASIRTQLQADTSALLDFNDKLCESGYFETQQKKYAEQSYFLKGEHLYRVTEGFPRITEAHLLPGVGNVQYTIHAAQCLPFATDSSVLQELTHAVC